MKVGLLVVISLAAFINSAKAGLDYYRIFLGKKLIYERYVNKPLDLQSLSVSAADANETLTIYYFQCNAPGKTGSNRSIALKDEKGNTIKQWSFANLQGTNAGMAIPVKELLQLQKANKGSLLSLYYTAEGRSEGEKLALVQTASNKVSYLQRHDDTKQNDKRTAINYYVDGCSFLSIIYGYRQISAGKYFAIKAS